MATSQQLESISAHVAEGRIDVAIRELERIVRADPSDVRSRVQLGDLFVRIGRTDQASVEYLEAVRRYSAQGSTRMAVGVAGQILRLPVRFHVALQLGELFSGSGLFSEAERALFDIASGVGTDGDVPRLVQIIQTSIARHEARSAAPPSPPLPSLASFAFRR